MPRIRFLLDENVSKTVVDVLKARGHDVIRAQDVFDAGTPDRTLAILIAHESMVIITHDRDFRRIREMFPEQDRRRYAHGAGRLQLEVPEMDAKRHLQERLPLIEFHYEECQRAGKPFRMILQKNGVKIQG